MSEAVSQRELIAAIATPPGRGGVAVIRLSGEGAFELAKVLSGKVVRPREVQYVDLKVDRAVMISFASPASYTGEDVVEFQTHGGEVTPKRVLELCLKNGARLAHRGEFTERAFLNGKLSLDEAEAVLDLIDAKTERAADDALEGLAGKRKSVLKALYTAALSISTDLEHALDISEDELPEDFLPRLESERAALIKSMDEAIKKAKAGKILRSGALVVLKGAPNAGKSSLMNALLGENRAIVSNIEGTTRDSIEEWLDLDGWPIRLVDTAGLRESDDVIEQEGVKRTEKLIKEADIVIGLDTEGDIRVHSKADLGKGEGLNVSAKTGEGLEELKAAIVAEVEKVLEKKEVPASDEDLSTIIEAKKLCETPFFDIVLAANEIRSAAEKLGKRIGAVYSEDLLTSVFSRFCVGK